MLKKNRSNRTYNAEMVFVIVLFVLLISFFLGYRPPIVNNGDDWAYIGFGRSAIPIWHEWNPARVMPEVILPLCAKIASSFVMPICGDYLWSITIVACVVLCSVIMTYFCLFKNLLKGMMKDASGIAMMLTALLFVMHFRSWMSVWIPSRHLFYSIDLNNYYFYTIPVLLNACFVLMFEETRADERFFQREETVRKGFLALGAYLAVFSNMYANCVLAIYAGVRLLEGMLCCIKRQISVQKLLQNNAFHMYVIALWCMCSFFEINGGRAAGFASGNASFVANVKTTIWALLDTVEQMEDSVFYLCIGLVLAAIIVYLCSKKRSEESREWFTRVRRYSICTILITGYLILLSAMVNPEYIRRMDIILGIMVYVFLIVMVSAVYLVCRFPRSVLLLPLIVFIMGIDVLVGMPSYALTNRENTTGQALFVSQNMLDQILRADANGEAEVDCIVPKSSAGDNWPYPLYMGPNVVRALKQHNMITNIEKVNIVPTQDYYKILAGE